MTNIEIMDLYDTEIKRGGSADAVIIRFAKALINRHAPVVVAWMYEHQNPDYGTSLLINRIPFDCAETEAWAETPLFAMRDVTPNA